MSLVSIYALSETDRAKPLPNDGVEKQSRRQETNQIIYWQTSSSCQVDRNVISLCIGVVIQLLPTYHTRVLSKAFETPAILS